MSRTNNILLVLIIIGWVGWKFYKMPKFSKGETLQPFQAELLDGTPFSTEEIKGDIILLDFWGSWCAPCRQESPALVSLYNDYHNKSFKSGSSFEIVSVAIETNENRWKSAITKDALNWKYHIVQLERFKSPIAKQFGVNEIPTKYLIGPDGVIVGANLKFSQIRQYLDKQLKN